MKNILQKLALSFAAIAMSTVPALAQSHEGGHTGGGNFNHGGQMHQSIHNEGGNRNFGGEHREFNGGNFQHNGNRVNINFNNRNNYHTGYFHNRYGNFNRVWNNGNFGFWYALAGIGTVFMLEDENHNCGYYNSYGQFVIINDLDYCEGF